MWTGGHRELSYTARRMVESLFEERLQALLGASGIKIENDDLLVEAAESGSPLPRRGEEGAG